MVVSLVAALASALCYGVAAVMQAMAVRAASRRTAADGAAGTGLDPGLLVRLLRQGPFLASIAIDMGGFGAQLGALRRLPLFSVQTLIAPNLALTPGVTLAETLPPAVVGVIFLGDTARQGLAAAGGVGFALAVACAVALAGFGEAGERQPTLSAGRGSEVVTPTASRRAALGRRELPD